MSRKPLLLVGGGGHCKACIEVIESQGDYRITGIIDLPKKTEKELLGYPVVGCDSELPQLLQEGSYVLITLGLSRGSRRRRELHRMVQAAGGRMATIISPLAHVSKHTLLDTGVIVMHQALINTGSHIGTNTIINSQALVEHDCTIGEHCHIATGARINGGCRIGDECLIGSGAILLPGISIAPGTRIGAGAVVTRNIEQRGGTWTGCPARPKT